MKTVVAFDFDGTLTKGDTFLEFIRYSKGRRVFFIGFIRFLPLLICMKLRLYPNWKAKQKVFSHFFRGESIEQFDAVCRDFCRNKLPEMIRPSMMRMISEYKCSNYELCIISASVDRWIRPWAETMGIHSLHCTEIETEQGIVTGKFATPNCYGPEKVRRLTIDYPNRSEYSLIAYGDSRGDRELLAFADKSYYKIK